MILVWTGLAIAALALIAVLASAGRLRRFLALREEVQTRLQDLGDRGRPRAGRDQGHAG